MVIGLCTIELYLPGCGSLKEKRRMLKPLLVRLRREFNVSVAEVDLHEVWQSASIAAVVVSTSNAHAERTLHSVLRWIEDTRPDLELVAEQFELIH